MSTPKALLVVPLWMAAISVQAAATGLDFYHKDWQVTCDNTRTCRAAGYQKDGDETTISLLLTRRAGPREPVSGEVMLGSYDDKSSSLLPKNGRLTMRINGRSVGSVQFDKGSLIANLSPKQIDALLAALTRKAEIEWRVGEQVWSLSDEGVAAVLLKMDEFQGRVGTPGALVKKGSQSEENVLPPLPVPVVKAAPLPKASNVTLPPKQVAALREALRATLKKDKDYCPDLEEKKEAEIELSFTRLNDSKVLVSTSCWRAAYNAGDGYWVINDKSPYSPVLVTTSGSDFSDGSIGAQHKGRGIGDCWSLDTWTWDGGEFVHTASSTTGMCRLIAAGGAWQLPRIVMEVRTPKQ